MNFSKINFSDKDINNFDTRGFLVVRKAFPIGVIKCIQGWADELANFPETPGRHWVYHETSIFDQKTKLLSRIENIQEFHHGFKKVNETLATAVGKLFRERAILFKEKLNFKLPGGDGFKPHQDCQAGWQSYAHDFITVVISIDRATEENGCLKIAPNISAKKMFREWEPLSDEDLNGVKLKECPTEPGDLIFFDAYTPHSSDPNMSNKTRRMYFATYNRASVGNHRKQYFADKHRNYPPDIEREDGKEYVFKV